MKHAFLAALGAACPLSSARTLLRIIRSKAPAEKSHGN